MDEAGAGLTSEQTAKLLQFQDLTGIEDLTVCRDVLQRHRWDLEVAIQEQLNIREGRPSLFATEARPPAVIRDHHSQEIFSHNDVQDPNARGGIRGLFVFVVKFVFSMCYFVTTLPAYFFNIFKNDDRRIVTDPLGDVMDFINSYTARYSPHPVFYQGTYSQALNDAKQELRFLIVYLHSESADDTPHFCRHTLSNPTVIQYINQNTLMWGCSVESPEGYRVAQSVGANRKFPLLLVVVLRENKMTIVGRIEGGCSPDLLCNRLRQIMGNNEIHLNRARADRVERSLNASIRAQQDEAYEESLRADQEKERRRREANEEEERIRKMETDLVAKEIKRKSDLVEMKKVMRADLPAEPLPNSPNVLEFLFKLPSGARLERRFRQEDSLEDIYNFIFCHPLSPDEFEITTNFPKRILQCSGDAKTLREVGLQNRDVLFINDTNA